VIDPVTQAAFAVQSNRGAYALLIGSGVSRGAGIKTGYEIVLDLADQVARLSGDNPGDPDAWYRAKFGEDLDYARLLERLGGTPTERQAILRHYFEPTSEERDAGEKQPTVAHRAIAALVAAGYVRIIITTNFDTLLEDALSEAGIRPYVVRGAPDVEGMGPPGQHTCLVVKVHGDYLDTRIRNTPAELDAYEPAIDKLLDRLLDDYGLIVCGWSSDWDGALRDAVRRIPHRRLTTFWTARGSLSRGAADLVANRSAVAIPIRDADKFFTDLLQQVVALDDLRQRPPLTVELAVAAAKRDLVDQSGRIRLRDLVKAETDAVLATLADLGDDNGVFAVDELERRLVLCETSTAKLAAVFAVGCYWGDASHLGVWIEALQRLGSRGYDNGLEAYFKLRGYPATICLYAGAIGALAAGRHDTLAALLLTNVHRRDRDEPAAAVLETLESLHHGAMEQLRKIRENKPNTTYKVPSSERLKDMVRPVTRDELPDDARFADVYFRAEALIALVSGGLGDPRFPLFFPPGIHLYRTKEALVGTDTLARMRAELQAQGDHWPPVATGLFPSADRAAELVDAYRAQASRLGLGW
jgi:SIR2-like domain